MYDQEHPSLMAPLRESGVQTAVRVRRRLRERWPGREFTVRSDALTVAWSHDLPASAVREVTRHHCWASSPAGGTLWSTPSGNVSVIEPLSIIVLDRGKAEPP